MQGHPLELGNLPGVALSNVHVHDSPSPSSSQPSTAPRYDMGLGSTSAVRAGSLVGLICCWSCTGSHSWCEITSTTSMLCRKFAFDIIPPPHLALPFFLPPLLPCSLNLDGGGRGRKIPHLELSARPASRSLPFSHLCICH